MIQKIYILLVSTTIAFTACNDTSDTKTGNNTVFKEEGKLTLYPTHIPYGTPDHIVFGSTIILDASHFVSNDREVEWEIYYSKNYNVSEDKFDSNWLSWHKEILNKGPFEFKPEGSGSYLIKVIPKGDKYVLVDGILNVTRNPNDGVAPTAKLNTVTVPQKTNEQLIFDATGTIDPDSSPLTYSWYIYKVDPAKYKPITDTNIKYTVVENNNIQFTHTFTESGYYYIKLIVSDDLYDIARDNESSLAYEKVYVRDTDATIGPVIGQHGFVKQTGGSADDERYYSDITIGDYFWYEIINKQSRFSEVIVICQYSFITANNAYLTKHYYFSTISDPASIVTDYLPADSVELKIGRENLRNFQIENFTKTEVDEFWRLVVRVFYLGPDNDWDMDGFVTDNQ